MSNILDKFQLDGSLFDAIALNIDDLQSNSQTRVLTVGKTVNMKGSINGVEVPAEITLREASLSRLSILEQKSPYTGKDYYLVTGVMNPVKMDIALTVDGEKISLEDLMYKFVTAKNETVDRQKFNDSLIAMGMNFNSAMPLFFQQFGANEEGFRHAIEAFKSAGAVDVTGRISNPGRIVAAYQHKTGVPLTSFEVGTTDRSKSRTNQGFLNFVDASVDTFQRVYGLRLQAHLLGQKTEGLSQAKIATAEEKRQKLLQLSRQWVSNWSGSQQRIVVSPSGAKEGQDIYDPVNAPCGRFTMVVNGSEVACDLWSNSARANATTPSATEVLANDEAPF
jgi:hypothetical protein